ncbi:MAG: hypothetical protein ACPG7F_02575 [Aggregatilineales bacterium]
MKRLILLFLVLSLMTSAAFACSGASHADSDEVAPLFETILDSMSEADVLDMVTYTPVALEDEAPASVNNSNELAQLLEMLLESFFPDISKLSDPGKI